MEEYVKYIKSDLSYTKDTLSKKGFSVGSIGSGIHYATNSKYVVEINRVTIGEELKTEVLFKRRDKKRLSDKEIKKINKLIK